MQRNNQPQKNKMNSKYTIFSLIIIVIAGFAAQAVTQNKEKENNVGQQTSITTEASQGKEYKFRKKSYLDQHFKKHGSEFDESFGYTTAEEYEAGASRVVNNPNALHKLEAEDGDDIYYLEATNEFVIVSTDGYLRTYFRPSSGIDYYNRQ